MQDGFVRMGAASPPIQVADCMQNAREIVLAAEQAAEQGVEVLVTPELGITGYTCGDLFLQKTLLDGAMNALQFICEQTEHLQMLLVVGLPLRHREKLYNCAAVLNSGRVLGLVPKSHPPNHAEFYELRHFMPAFAGLERFEYGFLRGVIMGVQQLFQCEAMPLLTLAVEIGEDLWIPAPPSVFHAAAGATVIVNLSASSETVGKAKHRRNLVRGQAHKLVCAYIYADANCGESTTDLVFSGHNIIAERSVILDEAPPFSQKMAIGDVDLGRLEQERRRITCYPNTPNEGYVRIHFELPLKSNPLNRAFSKTPFVPEDKELLAEHCDSVLAIQAAGLKKRMLHTGAKSLLVGVSGGVDSALTLLVCVRACLELNRPLSDIIAVTMPGFGTTEKTLDNAKNLCYALGIELMNIDISSTTLMHFKDIGQSEDVHDVVFENAQARVRTLTLMDLANKHNGFVVGTGDLSELALGWATYNGDHMSMYAVNASVPKTLIRHVLLHVAGQQPKLESALTAIVNTPISPELLPSNTGEMSQKTEDLVGPYELHDFFLYYMLRWSFPPRKILRLACVAFGGAYKRDVIYKWMRVFYTRFFTQQFKRNCMPDGPKVGRITVSPRGSLQLPSDACGTLWLSELSQLEKQL